MPIIYTRPNITNVTTASTASAGVVQNVIDGNRFTSYDTASANPINITLTFSGNQTIDSVHVIAEGITQVSASGIATTENLVETYNNRRALVFTNTSTTTTNSIQVSLTKTASTAKIYAINVMRRLLDLSTSSNRVVETFQTSQANRNSNVVEDLYGNRTVQRRHGAFLRNTSSYTIWQGSSNITAARNEYDKLIQLDHDHPNFTILDSGEAGATNYELCYKAHFVSGSFSTRFEGVNIISYSFQVEQE